MNEDILGNYMVLFDMNGYAPRWISLESSPADWTLNELMDIHAQGGHPAQEEKRFAERNANLLKDYLTHHPDTILYYVDDVDIRNSKEYQDSPLPGYFSNLVKEMELADKHKLYVFSHNSVPEKKIRIKDSMKTQSSVSQQDKANPADIAKGQSELKRICKPDSALRRMAIEQELLKRGRGFATLDDGTLVVPANTSEKANTIALCAHYDVVPGSLGYNDNGMSVVILLNMLDKLPENAEVVFTNGEETGMTGARNYLGKVNAHPRACINLDVCGCFDQVYLDPMNCPEARRLSNCKCGDMPPNDGYVFEAQGVPSVCFSTGPADVPFHAGIQAICSTLHNGPRDNDFELLNFSMIPKVQDEILKLLALLGDRAA
jgi:hypothetical protein